MVLAATAGPHVARGENYNLRSLTCNYSNWIRLPAAGPNGHIRKLSLQHDGQFLDAAALGGMVSGQYERQALRLRSQGVVKTSLAGKEDIRHARDGIADELAASATNNRHALYV